MSEGSAQSTAVDRIRTAAQGTCRFLYDLWMDAGVRRARLKMLQVGAAAAFLLAAVTYFDHDPGYDVFFLAFLFAIPGLEAFLASRQPSPVSRASEPFFLFGLLLAAVCWSTFSYGRFGHVRFRPEAVYSWAHGLSAVAFGFSFILLVATWVTLLRLVRQASAGGRDASDGDGDSKASWITGLQARPFYATLLPFATLCQVIALLAFTLALHDLPAGSGLRKAHESQPLQDLTMRSEGDDITFLANEPLENAIRSILKEPRHRSATATPYFRLELPFGTQIHESDNWTRIEALERHMQTIAGNAQQFRLHFVHRTDPSLVQESDRGGGRPTFETVGVTAVFAKAPMLLDYFSFTASTLVTTGHCDMAPISHFAKMVCLAANFYELFFTVVFFGAVVSILIQKKG
ncbi:MAG: hypothetical protein AAFY88_02250 [Acidobacteriota bacterium]